MEDVKQGCIAYKIAAHAADVARGLPGARDWDDDLSRARAALNWEKHVELAFDGETARAMHDEDMDADADFCAMCGHDWCAVRISKDIEALASGKHPDFQPDYTTKQRADLTPEQTDYFAHRKRKNACHSELVRDEEAAKRTQQQELV